LIPTTQVWHYTPATPRGRLPSSQASRSVTFACDEIVWNRRLGTSLLKSTANNRTWFFGQHPCRRPNFELYRRIFPFGSTVNNILEIGRRRVSKLWIFPNDSKLRSLC
jgi:hypothetical protein